MEGRKCDFSLNLLDITWSAIITRISLQVSHPNWALPMSSFAKDAFSSIGIPPLQDLSSGNILGAQYTPMTINPVDEKRSSSEASYLQFALSSGRTNLKLFTKTLAKKIVFNGKTATGVLVADANGTQYTITAKKEVILSAGAVCTRKYTLNSQRRSQLTCHLVSITTASHGIRYRTQICSSNSGHKSAT